MNNLLSTSFLLLCLLFFPLHESIFIEDAIVPYEDILNEPTQQIDPDKPMIALTFDDGPFKKNTEMILDTLKQYNAHATFFVLGEHVKNNNALLERMILEGHEIGNHTYSHYQLTTLKEKMIVEEINKTQEEIYHCIKRYPTLLRPPYGDYNTLVTKHLNGMKLVRWNVDSEDWKSKNTKIIVKKVMENVQNKSIILLHDQYITTAQAVAILVPQLVEEGYQLVRVSDLYAFE